MLTRDAVEEAMNASSEDEVEVMFRIGRILEDSGFDAVMQVIERALTVVVLTEGVKGFVSDNASAITDRFEFELSDKIVEDAATHFAEMLADDVKEEDQ